LRNISKNDTYYTEEIKEELLEVISDIEKEDESAKNKDLKEMLDSIILSITIDEFNVHIYFEPLDYYKEFASGELYQVELSFSIERQGKSHNLFARMTPNEYILKEQLCR